MRTLALALFALALPAAGPTAPNPKPPSRMTAATPPIIPHKLDPDAACADCHGPTRKGGTPGIPHRVQGYCQACHVPQTKAPAWKANARWDAEGLAKLPVGMRGGRATPGAPPSIPHAVHMRESCLACHGDERRPGMRKNPHPQRPHCQACHLKG